jgi:penicillin amidase
MLADRPRGLLAVALVSLLLPALMLDCPPSEDPPTETLELEGLGAPVEVVTDRFGVRHVFADDDFDMVRVQGYLHARDRIWQMDLTRREIDGTLAEVVGEDALGSDTQMRIIGLHRAAQRSYDVLTQREKDALQAYADGVNAWLDEAEASGGLPEEYDELRLTHVRRWTPQDTLGIGKGIAASLSLEIDAGRIETLNAFIEAGDQGGFDGELLYTQDVVRTAPMDPAATQPDADGTNPYQDAPAMARVDRDFVRKAAAAARRFRERAEQAPMLAAATAELRGEFLVGSNEWGVAAENSESGHPMIANDPHLSLGWPSTFIENHLVVSDDPVDGPLNVRGVTFPGVPFVILGQNEHIAWGATTNSLDVTDIFMDTLVGGAPECPQTLCIVSDGAYHPVDVAIEGYQFNRPRPTKTDNLRNAGIGIEEPGGLRVTADFRSFGPVVDVTDPSVISGGSGETTVLVLQFTGFHATGEVKTFRLWNRARNLSEFQEGLSFFDFGSQNWAYADADGNLGYFTSAELPLRADLEAGTVHMGVDPSFVRDGSGPANWIPDPAHSQGQAIPFAVLPYAEMPQTLNPTNGFFANANNDPAGVTLDNDYLNQRRTSDPNAIYYLARDWSNGLRAGRITRLIQDEIAADGKVSLADMRRFQGNTQQLDAELMVPFLVQAYDDALEMGADAALQALAGDPRVAEAAERLRAWDFSTPTGVAEGYDAHDHDGERISFLGSREIASSVAATIYNVWRGEVIRRVIDQRLSDVGAPGVGSGDALTAVHHLLSREPFTGVETLGYGVFPGGSSQFPDDPTHFSQLGSWLTVDHHPLEMSADAALRGAMGVERFVAPSE